MPAPKALINGRGCASPKALINGRGCVSPKALNWVGHDYLPFIETSLLEFFR